MQLFPLITELFPLEEDGTKEELEANEAQRRRAESLRLIQQWDEPSFADMRERCIGLISPSTPRSPAETYALVVQRRTEMLGVFQLLNFFETFGIMVEYGHVDEELLKPFFTTTVRQTWQLAKPFIDEARAHKHPISYDGFESLAQRWESQE